MSKGSTKRIVKWTFIRNALCKEVWVLHARWCKSKMLFPEAIKAISTSLQAHDPCTLVSTSSLRQWRGTYSLMIYSSTFKMILVCHLMDREQLSGSGKSLSLSLSYAVSRSSLHHAVCLRGTDCFVFLTRARLSPWPLPQLFHMLHQTIGKVLGWSILYSLACALEVGRYHFDTSRYFTKLFISSKNKDMKHGAIHVLNVPWHSRVFHIKDR